jgi:hypothetical protein
MAAPGDPGWGDEAQEALADLPAGSLSPGVFPFGNLNAAKRDCEAETGRTAILGSDWAMKSADTLALRG